MYDINYFAKTRPPHREVFFWLKIIFTPMGEQIHLNGHDKVRIGEWEFAVGPEKTLDPGVILRLQNVLNQHVTSYEPTIPYFFHTATGFPSPIVRIDMSTPHPNGSEEDLRNKIYEVEHRPSGFGILTTLNPETTEVLRGVFAQTEAASGKKAAIKLLPHAVGTEDTILFAQKTGIQLFGPEEDPENFDDYVFWARGYEEDGEMAIPYEERALAPVRDDGNKSYLVRMGIAQSFTSVADLDWSQSFCLKPQKGISCKGIEFWTPGSKETGTSTRSRIERTLSSGEPYLVQPFIRPEQVEINGKAHNVLYRVHAVFDWNQGGYEIIDGTWVARPNLRIHGASDAVNGPLRVPR